MDWKAAGKATATMGALVICTILIVPSVDYITRHGVIVCEGAFLLTGLIVLIAMWASFYRGFKGRGI